MNRTQRMHAVKRILREEFSNIELELVSSPNNQPFDIYRLRNNLRVAWAQRIVKALEEV